MKTRNPRNRRTFSQQFEATFGRVSMPRAGRKSLIALGMTGLLITGAASADWFVKDRDAIRVLEDIRDKNIARDGGSVTQHMDKLNDRFDVKGDTYDPEKDDDTKTKLAEAPEYEDKDAIKSRRCGGEKTPDEQKTVCEQIVQLEEDRYKYLQDMKTISEKRATDLKAITDERNGIGEEEYGKLQSNTNRLLALLAHQRIDQLNMDMAMATFDERIRERREQLNYLGAGALNPRNKTESGIDWGSIGGGAIQTATLEAALQVARERDR